MLQPSSELIRDLAARHGESLVSCYVPLARSGSKLKQNAIHFKHCQRAIAAASDDGLDPQTASIAARELTAAARAADDPRAPRAAGLALFAHPRGSVVIESPAGFAPFVSMGSRFYVVPLLACSASARPPVVVLSLSRHAVRAIDYATARELALGGGVPRALTDVVGGERRDASLGHHAVGTGGVFHGHGEGDDDVLPEVEAFCRQLAHALRNDVDRAKSTLLLAGDVQITAVFRRAAATAGFKVFAEQIHGSHDRTTAAQLVAFAAPLVAAWQRAAHPDMRALYGARCAEQRASDDPTDIAAAARIGRIETLLLDQTIALDAPRLHAAQSPHAVQPEGPFNAESALTLRHGGSVHLLAPDEMPTEAPQAAIYRF